MKKEIMNKNHERWEEFLSRLEGPEGCDFKKKDPDDVRSITWLCNGQTDRPFARAILETMENIDVEKSLEGFGHYCDCEILFNMG